MAARAVLHHRPHQRQPRLAALLHVLVCVGVSAGLVPVLLRWLCVLLVLLLLAAASAQPSSCTRCLRLLRALDGPRVAGCCDHSLAASEHLNRLECALGQHHRCWWLLRWPAAAGAAVAGGAALVGAADKPPRLQLLRLRGDCLLPWPHCTQQPAACCCCVGRLRAHM
jgi:hypothetical protein